MPDDDQVVTITEIWRRAGEAPASRCNCGAPATLMRLVYWEVKLSPPQYAFIESAAYCNLHAPVYILKELERSFT